MKVQYESKFSYGQRIVRYLLFAVIALVIVLDMIASLFDNIKSIFSLY